MPGTARKRDAATLMSKVCAIVRSKVETGHYDKLAISIQENLPVLWRWPRAKKAGTGEWDSNSDEDVLGVHQRQHEPPPRLDMEQMVAHYRAHGAVGTYLYAQLENVIELSDGTVANRVHVMPKYHLEWAKEREEAMRYMLDLAAAQTVPDIQAACVCRKTGTYDFNKHMWLRRNFVTIYVSTDGKAAIDMHKHAVEGAGWSEHVVFVQQLFTHKKRGMQLVCKGHGDSLKKRIVRNRFGKKGAKLKARVRAPAKQNAHEFEVVHVKPTVEDGEVKKYVSVAPVDGKCMAQTMLGKRCENIRTKGCRFCKNHKKYFETGRGNNVIAKDDQLRLRAAAAKKQWERFSSPREKEDFERAVRNSLVESKEDGEKAAKLRQRLLHPDQFHKTVPLEVVGIHTDGNCQFHALVEMLPEMGFTHDESRAFAIQCIEDHKEHFQHFFADDTLQGYLEYKAQDGEWGDGVALSALASILHRPIITVSDVFLDRCSVQSIDPLQVAKSLWEPPVLLAYRRGVHYDATKPMARESGNGVVQGSGGSGSSNACHSSAIVVESEAEAEREFKHPM